MTRSDEQMFRDADPYRPAVAGAVDEAAADLLGQIVAEPAGRRPAYRLAVVGVAAAVAAAAVAVPIVRGTPQPPPTVSTSISPSAVPPPPSGPLEPAKVRKAAQQGPRLVLGEPGWRIVHLEPYGERTGEMAYRNGERELMITWSPATGHDDLAGGDEVTVGGLTGRLVAYGKGDFDVVTEPHDGIVTELRGGGPDESLADFRRVLAAVRRVDAATWIAEVAPQLTRSGEAGDRASRLLMDMPAPPGWDAAALNGLPAGDPRAFDTALAKRVVCGWLTEWQRARAAGDTTASGVARDALLRAGDWPLLADLESHGSDLRRTVTTMAGRLTDGTAGEAEIRGYRQSLC